MATEKQTAANQANSEHSTGPRTEEGKKESRRNAVKTGLFGMGFIVPEHLETELLEVYDWLFPKVNPDNEVEHVLTKKLAHSLVMFQDAVRLQIHQKMKVAQRALLNWDIDCKLAAAKIADGLAKQPYSISLELGSSKHGCVVLLDLWAQLERALERNGDWTDAQKDMAYDLLGTPHPVRGPGGRLDPPADANPKEYLLEVYQSEVARLTALRDGDLHEIDETARAQAELGLLPDDETLRKYERGEARHINSVLKIVKQLEVTLGHVGLAARLNFPKRGRSEPKQEYNGRVFEYNDKMRAAKDLDRARADAERRRRNEEIAEAERTAQPEWQPGTSFGQYVNKLHDWHKRVWGPEAETVEFFFATPLRAKMTDALPPEVELKEEGVEWPVPQDDAGPVDPSADHVARQDE